MDFISNEKAIQREYGDQVLGIAAVPIQKWETPYAADVALAKGTMFPSLNLPFYMADDWIGGVTH
ncbi:MAG: spore coat associated protein CotJA [Lachnospiraceae bacterium]|nr:spore coat associated protein CotJA [Lachnospiraceae bacterium]